MDDDELGATGGGEPGAAVERAERLLRLPLVGVAGEGEERGVHGERDVVLARDLAEPLRPRVVQPEAALEVELAGRVAALEQELHRRLGDSREGQRAGPTRIVPMEPTVTNRS